MSPKHEEILGSGAMSKLPLASVWLSGENAREVTNA